MGGVVAVALIVDKAAVRTGEVNRDHNVRIRDAVRAVADRNLVFIARRRRDGDSRRPADGEREQARDDDPSDSTESRDPRP
jgi:hypothetical protein